MSRLRRTGRCNHRRLGTSIFGRANPDLDKNGLPFLPRSTLTWIDQYGDQDKKGFVEYFRQTPTGLAQQGWKDCYDLAFHADGTIAEGPIALCEVPGYVYAAKRAASHSARLLEYPERAESLLLEAQPLRHQINRQFWSDELGTYIVTLGGGEKPCAIRSTNATHTLCTEIVTQDQAEHMVKGFFEEEFLPAIQI